MQLEDWLDDLCVRFIINLPPEELASVERICFQVEEAQWFYEDFIRPLDPSLPSLPLKAFSLRIFQHCPLFSQWDAHHYTTAFAEFMAYKSRVPVRGAIMLNDAMDKVVLVKGWKKGANWSFPRGKINKDENDLDCAVREVYEETGFDVRMAGLVKEEKEMKSIDITMREQHMRLYVFPGVPEDTHFEPRTRKEISKIEWYKLTDLPTIKKHKHQDSNGGEHHGPSANKFYMVAPFLAPLKKWIHMQRKKENRYSSNLVAPPVLAEESEIEASLKPTRLPASEDQIPSDLPEVTIDQPLDPTAQLKQLFKVGPVLRPQPQARPEPTHMPQVDAAKSNALLSLLRGPSTAELRGGPNTPLDQLSFPPDIPQSPHHSHAQRPPSEPQPPPRFNAQSELPTSPQLRNFDPRSMPHLPGQFLFPQTQASLPSGLSSPSTQEFALSGVAPMAPYQQTGDPEFARLRQIDSRAPTVPPASALPKLTNHTKALLDVFKNTSPPKQVPTLQQPARTNQILLDLFNGSSKVQPLAPGPAALHLNQQRQPSFQPVVSPPSNTATPTGAIIQRPKSTQQSSLLELFGPKSAALQPAPAQEPARAELAATPAQRPRAAQGSKEDILLSLLQKQNREKAIRPQHAASTVREGETSATMSGPLNQPNFETINKGQKVDPNGMGRSPLTTHRTLFDPKQPTPVKIMARPETPRQAPGKSPRPAKAKVAAASPKRHAKPPPKEPPKPFQPQILKRPQMAEGGQNQGQAEKGVGGQLVSDDADSAKASAMSRDGSSERERGLTGQGLPQTEGHKQRLLSLFGGASPAKIVTAHTPSRVVSPLSTGQVTGQVASSKDEVPISAIEAPISTRPRVGSLVSVNSGVVAARPVLEKRQTGAQDKAFLLGMLSKIATQEG